MKHPRSEGDDRMGSSNSWVKIEFYLLPRAFVSHCTPHFQAFPSRGFLQGCKQDLSLTALGKQSDTSITTSPLHHFTTTRQPPPPLFELTPQSFPVHRSNEEKWRKSLIRRWIELIYPFGAASTVMSAMPWHSFFLGSLHQPIIPPARSTTHRRYSYTSLVKLWDSTLGPTCQVAATSHASHPSPLLYTRSPVPIDVWPSHDAWNESQRG